jgi:hypothetical protein
MMLHPFRSPAPCLNTTNHFEAMSAPPELDVRALLP